MSNRRLILIFVLALLLGGGVNVPATFVLKYVAVPNVSIQGVSGTVWSGEAEKIDVPTQYGVQSVNKLRWRVNPLYVFLGKAKAHITFEFLGGQAHSDVSVSLGKTISVNNFEYVGAAQPIVQAFSNGVADMTGDVLIKLETLSCELAPENNAPIWPEDVKGRVMMAQSKLVRPVPMLVGNMQVDITQSEDGALSAQLKGQQGEVDVSGVARVTRERAYSTDIVLTPTDKLQDSIRSALGLALPKQPNGSFAVKQQGVLR